ncbi:unnamed protein product [Anisakis simplex]|uniref:Reverse transcriptase domain-containing protein n=1 Tax=Anisakis simplex TaxID=6269 RepID=A0A0M3K9R1_ANISI|nr:unnamed protein product [Anisakis simplex]
MIALVFDDLIVDIMLLTETKESEFDDSVWHEHGLDESMLLLHIKSPKSTSVFEPFVVFEIGFILASIEDELNRHRDRSSAFTVLTLAIRSGGSQATIVTRRERQKWKNISQISTEEESKQIYWSRGKENATKWWNFSRMRNEEESIVGDVSLTGRRYIKWKINDVM